MLNQTGEFLIFDNNLKLALQPMLALSWKPNSDGSVWTFKLRPGVKFHNGQPMTADDVVYTFKQLSDPKNASNALSTFTGVLTPDGRQEGRRHRRSSSTSRRPTGTSPTWSRRTTTTRSSSRRAPTSASGRRRSSAPARSSSAATPRTSAPRSSPTPTTGATKPLLASTSFKFYSSQQPQILALQGGDVDVIAQFVRAGRHRRCSTTRPTRSSSSSPPTTASCRCATTSAPFNDPRVRQAVALSLDRSGMVAALLAGDGSVGNDSPFAPALPLDRHQRPAARPRTSPRPSSCCRPPGTRRHQRHADDRAVPGDPAAGPGDQGGPGEGRDQRQPQGRDARPATTARRRSATPTGSTAR